MEPISIRELLAWVVASGLAVTLVISRIQIQKLSKPYRSPQPKKVSKPRGWPKLKLNLKLRGALPKETRHPFLEDDSDEGWLNELASEKKGVSKTRKANKKARPKNNAVGRLPSKKGSK